jgi:hypothetical protein
MEAQSVLIAVGLTSFAGLSTGIPSVLYERMKVNCYGVIAFLRF